MNWRLIRNAIGEPEIDVRDDDDPTWGRSLLHELAREPGSGMERLAPGVYRVQRLPGDPTVSAS